MEIPIAGQTVGLGWLSGTGHGDAMGVVDVLRQSIGGVVRDRALGRWYRFGSLVGSQGSSVQWGPKSASSRADEWLVSVVQSDLDALGFGGARVLYLALMGFGVRWSRIDLFVDDWERVRDPVGLQSLWDNGQRMSHVRRSQLVVSSDGDVEGATVYFGSRTSDYYLRVYRRWAVTGVLGDAVRWEVELKHAGAVAVAWVVGDCDSPAALARVAWAEIAGLVDWRDVASGERADRCMRSAWFGGLVVGSRRACDRPVAVSSDYAARRRWLEDGVAGVLAGVVAAGGMSVLRELLVHGAARVRPDMMDVVQRERRCSREEVEGLLVDLQRVGLPGW